MEKRILEAIEYLLMAINDIKDYKDFINYKSELIKAINDIKNTIQNPFNINDSEENDKKSSKISSILGLQFDYDSLINENDIKFFSDYEEKNTFIKNKIDTYKVNSNNKDIEDRNKIKSKLKNNKLKKENNIINKNNKVSNPNKIEKLLKSPEYFRNKNNKVLTKFNSYNNENKKNIFKSRLYNTRYLHSKEKNKNKIHKLEEEEEKKQEEKMDIISEIIIKMNNNNYIYDTLLKLFGSNLPNKLLSNKVSDDLLEAIQNVTKEIEKINKKNNNKKISDKIDKFYKERIESIKNKSKIRKKLIKNSNINLNSNGSKDFKKNININILKRYKSFNLYEYNEPYQEFDFKTSLREQSPRNIYFRTNTNFNNGETKNISNKKIKSNKKGKDSPFKLPYNQKPFISATCGYGKYFDEPLQKGGLSKLNF